MLSVFFLFQEWSIANLFHRVKQLMPHFMCKFWNVFVNICNVYGLNCGHELDPASGQCTLALGTYCAWVFAENIMITTDHPSYSPDVAPCDFFLFPKVKTVMRGEHFGDVENIKRETTRLLKNLTSQDMQNCFLEWKKCWAKCIHLGGGDTLRVIRCPFRNNWN
jgi:hypothetical protein